MEVDFFLKKHLTKRRKIVFPFKKIIPHSLYYNNLAFNAYSK